MKRAKFVSEAAVEQLREAVKVTVAFQPHLRPDEPDWATLVSRFRLAKHQAANLITSLKRLWVLPFTDVQTATDLLLFQFVRLPGLRATMASQGQERVLRLCTLFDLFMAMLLQGNSSFPQNPTHLARLAQQAIETDLRSGEHLAPLLELLTTAEGSAPRQGHNPVVLADSNVVVEGEHERREGVAEAAWKSRHKFDLYRKSVLESAGFHEDWRSLKAHFNIAKFQDSRGIIRRSKLPERNWQPPTFPDLRVTRERFQVAFDFFCWKWFLYGMRLDEPLVEKLTYTFTPFGTQIFIPGYWSLDVHRDLDWGRILRLHRARGVARQGEKLDAGRKGRQEQVQRLLEANGEAKAKGLHGQARYDHLKRRSGLADATDNAQVRRMLREARGGLPNGAP